MARVGIIFGLLLCGVTLLGLIATADKSPTQFFPMMLGIPVLFCGVVSLNPHRRRYAMKFTSALAIIGTVAGGSATFVSLLKIAAGHPVNRFGLSLTTALAVISLILLASCLVWFMVARRRREASASNPMVELPSPRNQTTTTADTHSHEPV